MSGRADALDNPVTDRVSTIQSAGEHEAHTSVVAVPAHLLAAIRGPIESNPLPFGATALPSFANDEAVTESTVVMDMTFARHASDAQLRAAAMAETQRALTAPTRPMAARSLLPPTLVVPSPTIRTLPLPPEPTDWRMMTAAIALGLSMAAAIGVAACALASYGYIPLP